MPVVLVTDPELADMIAEVQNEELEKERKRTKRKTTTVQQKQDEEQHVDEQDAEQQHADEEQHDEQQQDETIYHKKLVEFNEKINEMVKQMKELQTYGKQLDKEFNSVSKQLSKLKKKNSRQSSRPLSGFAVPSYLTNELYDFLNIQRGTLIARKDVTRMMNEYIVANDCRDEKDKRNIIPDKPLQRLFKCSANEKITYFNLQTYMKQHYVK